MAVHLSREARCRHLPQLFRDLGRRLKQAFQPLGSKELKSQAAWDHGFDRRRQGYTAAMMVEESRILSGDHFSYTTRKIWVRLTSASCFWE